MTAWLCYSHQCSFFLGLHCPRIVSCMPFFVIILITSDWYKYDSEGFNWKYLPCWPGYKIQFFQNLIFILEIPLSIHCTFCFDRSKAYKPGSWNCWTHQWKIWNSDCSSNTSSGLSLPYQLLFYPVNYKMIYIELNNKFLEWLMRVHIVICYCLQFTKAF